MDLASRKYRLMEQFMKIATSEKLDKLENFFRKEILEEEISDDLKAVLDVGLEQINDNKTFSTEEVINNVKAKFKIA